METLLGAWWMKCGVLNDWLAHPSVLVREHHCWPRRAKLCDGIWTIDKGPSQSYLDSRYIVSLDQPVIGYERCLVILPFLLISSHLCESINIDVKDFMLGTLVVSVRMCHLRAFFTVCVCVLSLRVLFTFTLNLFVLLTKKIIFFVLVLLSCTIINYIIKIKQVCL